MSESLKAFYKVSSELSLTEIRVSDVDSIVQHINDERIFNNTLSIPYPYYEEDALEFIDICRTIEFQYKQICNFAIRFNGEMIGSIGILYNYGLDSHKSEFGYWLSPYYWDKGIMTKIIVYFTALAFEEFGLKRLEANVFTDNPASCKVLEKAGFLKEGLIRSSFMKEKKLKDTYLYAIVANKEDVEI